MHVPLVVPVRRWRCGQYPPCGAGAETRNENPHVEFHFCPSTISTVHPRGIAVPMVEEHEKARVLFIEREDYVGDEVELTYINRRPVMALRTERWDGSNDCIVLPGLAVTDADAYKARKRALLEGAR